jgi:hypothetical protein
MVTPDRLSVQTTLAGIQQYLLHNGLNAVQAKGVTVMALYKQVAVNASVMAFQDCFYIAGIICLIAVLPTLLLRVKRTAQAGGPRPRPAAMD